MSSSKITVIIPTRERCDVLESALRTVTSQDYDNLEIIVSDNFSDDDTAGVVRRANDHRIRYLNTGKRLSMSHNWEFALAHVEDGWVNFMGDDDGLLPASLRRIAEIIDATDVKAVRSNFCTYDWPGVTANGQGQLIVPMTSGIEERQSIPWLQRVLEGRARYNQLPMMYNGGFIDISILKQIKQTTGSFFQSANPDVYSAVAISRTIDRYVYTKEPLAIGGTSRHSNGHSYFSVSSKKNDSPRKQFANEGNIPFHRGVPLCADGTYPLSLQACVYEAYLQSDALGKQLDTVSPSQQLEVIIATAGKHRESILEWGKRFADLHGVDYAAARRRADQKRYLLQSGSTARKIYNAVNAVITESLPIKNIHEASIAASVIRSSPGKMDSIRYMARQLAEATRKLRL
jgi:hypothetical protein